MREEIRRKLDRVKELLKQGYSLRRALKEVKLGWKTYYQYEDYILRDPEVPRPERKEYIRVGPLRFDRSFDTILRDVARYTAERLVIKKYRTVYLRGRGKEVRELAKALRKKWLEELALSSLGI